MEDMVLVSEVAYLAKERDVPNFRESFQQLVSESAGDYETKQELSRDLGTRDEAPFFINESSGVDMLGLLDDWGDVDGKEKEVVSYRRMFVRIFQRQVSLTCVRSPKLQR